MSVFRRVSLVAVFGALVALLVSGCAESPAEDPLPSWNEGRAKNSIISFVVDVSTEGGEGYVPPAERIAVFDNDGCLWSEQPMYTQLAFAMDRVKALADQHPEWKEVQPFKGILENDIEAVMAGGEHALLDIIMATHAGNTTEEFAAMATEWLATARHPTTGQLYTDMTYTPMVELIAYLQDNGFKTFIVSGGGIEFIRPWSEEEYGIPPEQVIGSSIVTRFEMRDGVPALVRLPEIDFIDDKAGKPVGINQHIGRRPIAAFGNSDGDLQMLQWCTAGDGRRLGMLVHHTDAEREWAYDRSSSVGRLDRALDEAEENGWIVVDMKEDWRRVFDWE